MSSAGAAAPSAVSWPRRSSRSSTRGVRQGVLPPMLNWARDVMSRLPPRPIEALWLRASIALAGGLEPLGVSRRRALPSPSARQARTDARPRPHPVRAHAVPRRPALPDGGRLGAERSAARTRWIDSRHRCLRAPTAWDRIAADRLEAGGPRLAERTAALERAAGLFERLASHETLAAEANLRLGYVRLRQGQSDAALAHFDRFHR